MWDGILGADFIGKNVSNINISVGKFVVNSKTVTCTKVMNSGINYAWTCQEGYISVGTQIIVPECVSLVTEYHDRSVKIFS